MTGEIVLPGGYTQTVVRVGDTVRRKPSRNAPFVRDLLAKLDAIGFADVPRWLGTDDQGREIFSFVEGEVPPCLAHFDDAVLAEAARYIRRFHDATARLREDGQIVCHNDLSPCNFAFRDGVPSAIIDFDLAAPGERLFDLGYAAWTWLDLGNEDDYSPEEQHRRLTLFAAAYGREIAVADLIDAVLLRQRLLVEDFFGPSSEATKQWAASCHTVTLALKAKEADSPKSRGSNPGGEGPEGRRGSSLRGRRD